jgi:hypothetical protein
MLVATIIMLCQVLPISPMKIPKAIKANVGKLKMTDRLQSRLGFIATVDSILTTDRSEIKKIKDIGMPATTYSPLTSGAWVKPKLAVWALTITNPIA